MSVMRPSAPGAEAEAMDRSVAADEESAAFRSGCGISAQRHPNGRLLRKRDLDHDAATAGKMRRFRRRA
jgi:hypothetical protein